MSMMYNVAKTQMLKGQMNIEASPVFAVLIDLAQYTPDATHVTMESIPSAARIGTPSQVANVTVSDMGVVTANNTVFADVNGDTIEAIILYRFNGSDASNYPIVMLDNASTLSIIPDGTDIVINWGNGDGRVFGIG